MSIYVGVNGAAKPVKQGYVGVSGQAQELYPQSADGKAGVFMALGQNIYKSTDGISWTPSVNLTSANYRSIGFGNGIYVACVNGNATTNNVRYSVDGLNWNTASAGIGYPGAVHFGNGVFIIRPTGNTGSVETNRLYATSTNGINWTVRDFGASTNSANIDDQIAFGAGIFVFARNSATYYTSPDAVNWVARTLPTAVTVVRYI